MRWIDIAGSKKNILFVGESGCGKTELSLNCAVELAAAQRQNASEGDAQIASPSGNSDKNSFKTINLLDMDQTKPAFRARQYKDEMKAQNVELIHGEHLLDSPIVPPGMLRLLKGEAFVNVMDVGGNEIGAITMGQFADAIKATDNIVFFIINPYRILSTTEEHIRMMIDKIRDYGGFDDFRFIANPNMGEYTDAAIAEDGRKAAEELATKLGIEFEAVTFPEWAKNQEAQQDVIYIKRYLQYP